MDIPGTAARSTRASAIHDGPLPRGLCDAAALASPVHGAVVSFLGVVRNHHHGRGVTRLVYQCYRPMAERLLARLIAEAAENCDNGLSALVVHGVGLMHPGDVALAIHVGSAHRAAAFDACRQLIERIKQDLPVWKREHYDDGSDAWLKGS
jgi:molybdopterin synthase catalytic subunit